MLLVPAVLAVATQAAQIALERSADLKNWQLHRIEAGQVLADGSVVVSATETAEAFRLRIDAGGGPVVMWAETPAEARSLAGDLVLRLNAAAEGSVDDVEGAGGELEFAGPAAFYFDHAFAGGDAPAYVEFKLRRKPTGPTGPRDLQPIFRHGAAEEDPRTDAGYITVCLHRGDLPVSAYATRGAARFEKLLARVQAGSRVKLFRFDDTFMTAEDDQGAVLASLGSAPYLPDPQVLQIPESGFEYDTAAGPLPPVLGPRLNAASPATYAEFVRAWRENSVFAALRNLRTAAAADAWDFAGDGPRTVSLALRAKAVLNTAARPALRAESTDATGFPVMVSSASGLVEVTALANDDALVTIWYADGSRERVIVETLTAGGFVGLHGIDRHEYIPGKKAGWTLTGEVMASKWSEQPKYDQIWNDPQMCPTTVSGCGPTAWAMFYAYWDNKGFRRAFGDLAAVDAPLLMGNPLHPSVLACTRSAFLSVGEICFPKLDRAATLPGMMHLGVQWAQTRSLPLVGKIRHGLPYASPFARSLAREAINLGVPTIVGIGVFSHYPLAYGYRTWEYKTKKGKTLKTDYDLRMNLGWGADHAPEWRALEQIWYATSIRPQ